MSRYGKLTLHGQETQNEVVMLRADAPELLDELSDEQGLKSLGLLRINPLECACPAENRGLLKQELMRLGYPVLDYAGYHEGQALSLTLRRISIPARLIRHTIHLAYVNISRRPFSCFKGQKDKGEAVWWCCLVAQGRQL